MDGNLPSLKGVFSFALEVMWSLGLVERGWGYNHISLCGGGEVFGGAGGARVIAAFVAFCFGGVGELRRVERTFCG